MLEKPIVSDDDIQCVLPSFRGKRKISVLGEGVDVDNASVKYVFN